MQPEMAEAPEDTTVDDAVALAGAETNWFKAQTERMVGEAKAKQLLRPPPKPTAKPASRPNA